MSSPVDIKDELILFNDSSTAIVEAEVKRNDEQQTDSIKISDSMPEPKSTIINNQVVHLMSTTAVAK